MRTSNGTKFKETNSATSGRHLRTHLNTTNEKYARMEKLAKELDMTNMDQYHTYSSESIAESHYPDQV